MKRRADGSFLPEKVEGTCRRDAGLSLFNAHRLHEEKTDFACLDGRIKKSFHHDDRVTTVTDSKNPGLLMSSYSASAIFEFAAGSSSGEIQVDSRPSLNRANSPGKSSEFEKIGDMPRAAAKKQGPFANKNFPKVSSAAAQRPDSRFNYLKTATSAFQVYLLPAAKHI